MKCVIQQRAKYFFFMSYHVFKTKLLIWLCCNVAAVAPQKTKNLTA